MKKPTRSTALEYMDIGPSCYTSDEYRDCLTQLGRVGRLLGGDRASFSAFDRLSPPPGSILDVGCGGGHFAMNLAKRFPQARVVGTDISSDAIAYAQEQHQMEKLSNLSFERTEKKELESAPNSFDVVTATMVCHHMSDEEIVEFFKRATAVASRAVIINDLHRHPLAWMSYALVGPVLFHNRLITHDGLLSIRKGFKWKDWNYYLDRQELNGMTWTCSWKWAFRWIVSINLETAPPTS